jgi:hypothetical protein
VGKQLVSDIRATRTEAVTDHETISNERFMEFLNRELPQCGYLIVIQTPAALQSLRVQATVNMALTLIVQQRIRRVLRVIAVPSQNTKNQSLWDTLYTFDASMDYPRARDKIFIELGLISLDADDSFFLPLPDLAPTGVNLLPQPFSPGPMPRAVGSNWPPQPSGPTPRPTAPAGFSGTPALQGNNRLVPALKRVWHNLLALFARPWKTSQTSIAAQLPDELLTLREDRPLPLNTLRRTIIGWAIAIGIVLILVLASILTIALVKNHADAQKLPLPHALPYPKYAFELFRVLSTVVVQMNRIW